MKRFLKLGVFALFLLAMIGFLFYPLDYYIYKPGNTYNTADFVTVDGADKDDEGSFSLTTVAVMKGTPLSYVSASMQEFYEVRKVQEVRLAEEDDEEYEVRQIKMMDDSKFSAIAVAFEQAGLTYEIDYKGLYILNVYEGSAADGVIQAGDVIVEAQQETLKSMEQFQQLIEPVEEGKEIEFVIDRDGQLLTKSIQLKEIPGLKGQVGIGISYNELKTVKSDPHVDLATDDIGGPSAGLMFTLEILNQLKDEDLTKGYDIAGTGEMYIDGSVGRIGGVEKKVVSAHEEEKDYFFVPDDEITEAMKKNNPKVQSNYEAALETAKKIGTTMEIVPVKTIEDALDFLQKLEPNN